MSNTISIIASVLGMISIFMAWLINRRNQDLSDQLERANDRLGNLQQQLAVQQTNSEQEQVALRQAIHQLKEATEPMTNQPETPSDPALSEPFTIQEITPQELHARLEQGDELMVVDMRQPFEYAAGHIPGAVNIFIEEIPYRLKEIPNDKPIIFQCWHGHTSLDASAFLISQGWPADQISSLRGGIAGWLQTHGRAGLVKD